MPRYGFNFLWMFVYEGAPPPAPDEHALDFLVKHGFDFVRIPTDYNFWTKDFNYFEPDERVFDQIDRYVDACRSRGLHMSLNLHRAPGYCINGNDREKHNLWRDKIAQDAFVFLWQTFAVRYKGVPSSVLSFDLVNEPPSVGQYGMTRDNHAAIIRRTVAAIRGIDPTREIAIDPNWRIWV
jgi:endoglucanase